MYNIIFSLLDIRETLTEEQTAHFVSRFDFVAELPESRKIDGRILYQGDIGNAEALESIKTELEVLDAPDVIGMWNKETGLQQGYIYEEYAGTDTIETIDENGETTTETIEVTKKRIVRETDEDGGEVVILYPFNLTEYKKYLADVVIRNTEGEETSRRRPTTEEAKETQVNRFGGLPDRQLG